MREAVPADAARAAGRSVEDRLQPERAWLPPPAQIATMSAGSFVDSPDDGIRIRFFCSPDGLGIAGRAYFGPRTQGPPGFAHGGSIAAVLDHAIGAVTWLHGHTAVVAELNLRFLAMVPLGEVGTIEAIITSVSGKKIHATAAMRREDGVRCAEAEGLLIMVPVERFGALGKALPLGGSDPAPR
ncbi:MAG: PaaI family thioesterase [Candidatus Schekmanbacteria bacterium]|nr:PaaI family thioesterase [Candidatus Schekmanbacteria bacterium]